ncbi:mannitol dehydrogenase family protein [Natranaerovirga hydrolytica]|uniref:mannitol dehydrogenase family protein n=1 Tax=Natranaerovirga hydrolytica TaxID=680378 RepID=UPI001A9C029D
MKLNRKSIEDYSIDWEKNNIQLPEFDYETVKYNTKKNPTWIHFGAGNIFRGFVANAYQELLNSKKVDTGIIAAESFDFEIIEKIYKKYEDLTLLVKMNASGDFDKSIIGSIVESITTDNNSPLDHNRLIEVFENPSLEMASFTITEKGYALTDAAGEYLGIIKKDIEEGIEKPVHTMSIIASLAYRRYLKGEYPMTFVSMDNCSHNGDKLKTSVITIAKEWAKKGFVEDGFIQYLEDESKITFPYSMIDKITPRPSETVKKHLESLSIEDMDIVITSKNSYMAPFVNAEVSEYLVIEDKFTNGRPPLEEVGIIFTDRQTVNQVETMKVTTCLNPLHTALAVSGCLLGHTLIADEMKDGILKKFVETIGYTEGLKVVVDPEIINPKDFLNEVVSERFANPFIPDTPQRIATDTSQKVGIRFGETIKAYEKREDLKASDLVAIPLAIATWCRYLLGVDDEGNTFELSSDPLLATLKESLTGIAFGDETVDLSSILANKSIFGLDLYDVGLGQKIEEMFIHMIKGKGAVRATLEKYL